MLTFDTSTPEKQGISSGNVLRMLRRLRNKKIPMHSILLMRNDVIVAEGYYAPYNKDTLHRMFSIIKSINAIAIGFCAEDGLLSLDDTIVSFFPEYSNASTHPRIKEMTIRNMLMMRTCHASTTYKDVENMDWIESFFKVPPTHKPGSIFHYDTSCSHVLCTLVEKLTGKNSLDYLKEKVPELGLSEESYLLLDPYGHPHGGSGLMALPKDLLRFGYFLLHEGNIGQTQYLSREYIHRATSFLTATEVTAPVLSEAMGYGYQIWRNERGGFTCYGMGGQLIIVLPEENLICVTTADTQGIAGGNQAIYDAFYEEIVDNLSRAELSDNPGDYRMLQHYLQHLSIPSQEGIFSPEESRKRLEKYCGKVYEMDENIRGMSSLSLSCEKDLLCLSFRLREECHSLYFGIGKLETGTFTKDQYRYAGSGAWIDEDSFYIRLHIIDSCIGSLHFQLSFQDEEITVFVKKMEESLFQEFTGHFHGKSIIS